MTKNKVVLTLKNWVVFQWTVNSLMSATTGGGLFMNDVFARHFCQCIKLLLLFLRNNIFWKIIDDASVKSCFIRLYVFSKLIVYIFLKGKIIVFPYLRYCHLFITKIMNCYHLGTSPVSGFQIFLHQLRFFLCKIMWRKTMWWNDGICWGKHSF